MHRATLFSLLPFLALTFAVPHKRQCNATFTSTTEEIPTSSAIPTLSGGGGGLTTPSLAPIASGSVLLPSGTDDASSATTGATGNNSLAIATEGGSCVGLAINEASGTNLQSFGGKLSWYYNWGLSPASVEGNYEFVPMVLNEASANAFNGVPAGAKYILGFNEPDQGAGVGGTGIPAVQAAELHKQWTGKVDAGVQIGSPAVARGGTQWMDDWVTACAGACKYDFVPFHYYGTDVQDLISYVKTFYGKYQKPLWLTEWACRDYGSGQVCDESQVKEFMKTAVDFFEGEGKQMVARWAWFGAFPALANTDANGLINTDLSANPMGKYYASL